MDTSTILTSENLTNTEAISLICNTITMTSKDAPLKEVGKVGVAGLVVKHGEGGAEKL